MTTAGCYRGNNGHYRSVNEKFTIEKQIICTTNPVRSCYLNEFQYMTTRFLAVWPFLCMYAICSAWWSGVQREAFWPDLSVWLFNRRKHRLEERRGDVCIYLYPKSPVGFLSSLFNASTRLIFRQRMRGPPSTCQSSDPNAISSTKLDPGLSPRQKKIQTSCGKW